MNKVLKKLYFGWSNHFSAYILHPFFAINIPFTKKGLEFYWYECKNSLWFGFRNNQTCGFEIAKRGFVISVMERNYLNYLKDLRKQKSLF